jgi:hypothetical protein
MTSHSSRTRIASAAIKQVAHYLGNTPAVCRSSYVDPRVLDRFASGLTIAEALATSAPVASGEREPIDEHSVSERVRRAVLDLIVDDATRTGAQAS